MTLDKALLEELEEEETVSEKVILKKDENKARKIARILQNQKHNYNLEHFCGPNIPEAALAIFFSRDPEETKRVLKENPKNAFLDLIEPEIKEMPVIDMFFPQNSPMHLVKKYSELAERRFSERTEIFEDNIFKYIDGDPIATIAAKSLIKKIPLVSKKIDEIGSMQDIVDIINCYKILSSAKGKVKEKIKKTLEEKKKASELLENAETVFFSEQYPAYSKFIDILRKGEYNPEITSKVVEEFFPNMKIYEKAACLYDLIEDYRAVRQLFPFEKVQDAIKKEIQEFAKNEPDFAGVWKKLVNAYHNGEKEQKSYRKIKEEDLEGDLSKLKIRINPSSDYFNESQGKKCSLLERCGDGRAHIHYNGDKDNYECIHISDIDIQKSKIKTEFPEKLGHYGYANLCTQFVIEENIMDNIKAIDGEIKVGDLVGIFNASDKYRYSKDGSWGYAKRIYRDDIDIEFRHLTTGHEVPITWPIKIRHVKKIEFCDEFHETKKKLEKKYGIDEYLFNLKRFTEVSERINSIYKH